jgi:hypothetical protein
MTASRSARRLARLRALGARHDGAIPRGSLDEPDGRRELFAALAALATRIESSRNAYARLDVPHARADLGDHLRALDALEREAFRAAAQLVSSR